MADDTDTDLLGLTGAIVATHVANNRVHAGELPGLIRSVREALSGLSAPASEPQPEKPQGAVGARKSLANPGHILSMIDGKPYKALKRHIGRHGYTPESYREAFDLPRDYPMTSAHYTETRRALAHQLGLGRKPKAEAAPAAEPMPARRTRKPKALGDAHRRQGAFRRGVAGKGAAQPSSATPSTSTSSSPT